MVHAVERRMQLHGPATSLVRQLERKEPRIDAGTDPIAVVRSERLALRLVAGVEQRQFGIRDALEGHEEIDVGHPTDARLFEIHVRGVKSLEHDWRDPTRDERVDWREDFGRNALCASTPV